MKMLKKICSSELPSRNNAGETIKPASVAGNELTRNIDSKVWSFLAKHVLESGYHGNSLGPKDTPNDVR